jgi:hypothetical protein
MNQAAPMADGARTTGTRRRVATPSRGVTTAGPANNRQVRYGEKALAAPPAATNGATDYTPAQGGAVFTDAEP